MISIEYREFWTVPVDQVPAKTGAAGVMDCADILDVLEHLDLDLSEKTVLDVGCGTGRLAQLCGEYLGLDVSPSAVEYARARGINAHEMDHGIPHVTGVKAFDLCAFLSVFTHIARADRCRDLLCARDLSAELLVDILPGEDGGSIAAWYADPAEFEFDLHDAGFDNIIGTYERTSADGATHLYYHCR